MSAPMIEVRDGLATLHPLGLRVERALEAHFLAWARESGASEFAFPPIERAADLTAYDYFLNFPHLCFLPAPLREEAAREAAQGGALDTCDGSNMRGTPHVLSSAACYRLYTHLKGTTLHADRFATMVGTCFRHEASYAEPHRLRVFRMREIVCVGARETVQAHLETHVRLVRDLCEKLALPVEVQVATDPFFEPMGPKARHQRLFPVKRELCCDGVAIASFNFHRDFFGERAGIQLAGGGNAYSGCVAFGLERWIERLAAHWGSGENLLEVLAEDAERAA